MKKIMHKRQPFDATALSFGDLRKHCDRLGLKPAGKKRSDYLAAFGVEAPQRTYKAKKNQPQSEAAQ